MKSETIPLVLLYRRPRQSRTLCAFFTALIISGAAVAIAGMHSNTQTENIVRSSESFEIIGTVDAPPPVEELSLPPLNELPVPNLPDAPEFIDEQRPLPPESKKISVTPPIKRMPNGGATVAFGKAMSVFTPRPEYPYEARRQKITGNGIALIAVDSVNGTVLDVSMAQGAGSSMLDNAAIAGLKRWRFKPGTAGKIRCPITFTLTGATY
jgi:TonB family protein